MSDEVVPLIDKLKESISKNTIEERMTPLEESAVDGNFLGLPSEYCTYDKAKVVLIPAPYEETVSYGGGTAKGPEAIVKASQQIEYWDQDLRQETWREFPIAVVEPLPADMNPLRYLQALQDRCSLILKDGKLPFVLGGEHTVAHPNIIACLEDKGSLTVIHFDAHMDFRNDYHGNPWSHACVMRRAADRGARVLMLGVRSFSKEETDSARAHRVEWIEAREVLDNLAGAMSVIDRYSHAGPTYVSFDVDAFDPSVVSETGTPVIGGLPWYHVLALLRRCRNIVGCDVVELAPKGGYSADVAALLVYKMIGMFCEANR